MLILIPILIMGLVLRLLFLNQSFWLDEAISALAARDYSYNEIVFEFLKVDNHPPLFYVFLKFWGDTFGYFDWVLRTMSVGIGTLLIYVTYKLVSSITGNKKLSLFSAFLTAASPLLIYYSQEVRMYILITMLVALQIWVFSALLKKQEFWKWTTFAFLNCVLFFSDYVTVFFFPVLLLYPLIKKDFKLLFKVVLSFAPLGLLFFLWYPMFNAQLLKNSQIINSFPGWQNIVGGATFKNLAVIWMKFVLGRISFEPKLAYYGLVLLGSIPLLAGLYLSVKQIKKYLLIWLWLLVPVILGFSFSVIIPVFNYFRFIYVLPALLVLVLIGLFNLKSKFLQKILIGSILLSNLIGLSIYYFDPSQQRENWRQVTDFIESHPRSGDLVVFEFLEPIAPYRWYTRQTVEVIGATDSYSADPLNTPAKLNPYLEGKTRVYHFDYLRDLTDPTKIVEQTLEKNGFIKGEVLNDFKNIGQLSIWSKSQTTP